MVRVRTAGGNTHVRCCNGCVVCFPMRPLGIVEQKNRFSAPSKQGIACSLAMERRVKTAFRRPRPFQKEKKKTQSSGDFFTIALHYVRAECVCVCGVAVGWRLWLAVF